MRVHARQLVAILCVNQLFGSPGRQPCIELFDRILPLGLVYDVFCFTGEGILANMGVMP